MDREERQWHVNRLLERKKKEEEDQKKATAKARARIPRVPRRR